MRRLARMCIKCSALVGKFTALGNMFEGWAIILINRG